MEIVFIFLQFISGSDSLLSIFSLGDGNNYDTTLTEELHTQKRKKKNEELEEMIIPPMNDY